MDDFVPIKKKPKPIREKRVEAAHRDGVRDAGGLSLKFVSPGRAGVPDRIDLHPIPPEHREIVARYIQFTELKAPGKSPTPNQLREHERLRALGFIVNVKDHL